MSVEARLAELAAEHDLPAGAGAALARLLELVAADPHAPTTVRDPGQAVDVHVADSLSALVLPEMRGARRIADLGAGAGFPGLALAVALPDAEVALVESVGRKCAFMVRAIAVAAVANARVVCARAEEWREGLAVHDLVTARAVAPLAVLTEYAAPLLALGGVLVAWKGAADREEQREGEAAAAQLGLERRTPVAVRPWKGVEARHLYLYSKVSETPARFPRRAGMARKRPLGHST